MCAVGTLRERKREFAPPRPFAGRDQEGGEQAAEDHPHLRADQPGLDRILHQEDAAEREREPADPDHPARAEALLEAFRRLGRFDGRSRRRAEGLGRLIDALGRGRPGEDLERRGAGAPAARVRPGSAREAPPAPPAAARRAARCAPLSSVTCCSSNVTRPRMRRTKIMATIATTAAMKSMTTPRVPWRGAHAQHVPGMLSPRT